MEHEREKILFVCKGNVCRSPLAAAILKRKLEDLGVADWYEVDSAGTHGSVKQDPYDPRTVAEAAKHDVTLEGHSRRLTDEDLRAAAYVIAMDRGNRRDLCASEVDLNGKVHLMGRWLWRKPAPPIPDPYDGWPGGFALVYRLLDRACARLAKDLAKQAASR